MSSKDWKHFVWIIVTNLVCLLVFGLVTFLLYNIFLRLSEILVILCNAATDIKISKFSMHWNFLVNFRLWALPLDQYIRCTVTLLVLLISTWSPNCWDTKELLLSLRNYWRLSAIWWVRTVSIRVANAKKSNAFVILIYRSVHYAKFRVWFAGDWRSQPLSSLSEILNV